METIFWISALIGTIFFALKILFSSFGLMSEDVDHADIQADGLDHGTDRAFSIFSIHSLTGFFMMFGWVGLACFKQHALSSTISISFALLAGILMMGVTSYLFKLSRLLVSPGSNFQIEELVGREAVVYQKIPDAGAGKIQITVNGYQREIRAISANHEQIASFTLVKVEKIIDNNTVSVRPALNL